MLFRKLTLLFVFIISLFSSFDGQDATAQQVAPGQICPDNIYQALVDAGIAPQELLRCGQMTGVDKYKRSDITAYYVSYGMKFDGDEVSSKFVPFVFERKWFIFDSIKILPEGFFDIEDLIKYWEQNLDVAYGRYDRTNFNFNFYADVSIVNNRKVGNCLSYKMKFPFRGTVKRCPKSRSLEDTEYSVTGDLGYMD